MDVVVVVVLVVAVVTIWVGLGLETNYCGLSAKAYTHTSHVITTDAVGRVGRDSKQMIYKLPKVLG